jgi:D-lyxose ketol-isomerase
MSHTNTVHAFWRSQNMVPVKQTSRASCDKHYYRFTEIYSEYGEFV